MLARIKVKDNGVALGRSGRIRGEGQVILANIDVNRCGRNAGEKNGSEREELDAHFWVWEGVLRFQLKFKCELEVQNYIKNEDPEDISQNIKTETSFTKGAVQSAKQMFQMNDAKTRSRSRYLGWLLRVSLVYWLLHWRLGGEAVLGAVLDG